MNRDQFLAKLRQIEPDNEMQIATLAHEVAKEAREPVQVAVVQWKGSDPAMSHKALLFLSNVDELAIQSLVETPAPPKPEDRVWMMQTVVAHELALRERVAVRLRRLLEDKTLVPIFAPPQHVEEKPIPRRVCDEAYMEMRRLLNVGESQERYYNNMRVFLALTETDKNAAINRARKSPPVWTRFVIDE